MYLYLYRYIYESANMFSIENVFPMLKQNLFYIYNGVLFNIFNNLYYIFRDLACVF